MINKILIILFSVISTGTLFAQSNVGLIEVSSAVDTAEIFIGDQISYSIEIKRDKNLRIEKPGEGLNLGMFEIKSYNFLEPVEENDVITERYEFSISVFDTGKFTIPPFPIAYFPDTSRQFKIIEASAIDIYVKSVLSGDEAPELKDIKPPLIIPFDYMFLYSMLAILLMIGLAIFLGYRAWKAKKEKGYIFSPPSKPRPAHEVALEELKKLFASNLLEEKQFKAFYSRLSEILRGYMEGRYFVMALEETTWEILRDLVQHVDEKQHSNIKEILEEADLVKFAKHIPESAQTEKIKKLTLQFINDTKVIYSESVQEPVKEESVVVEAVN